MKWIILILALSLIACEDSETSIEVCDGSTCVPTETGPGEPITIVPGTESTSGTMILQSFTHQSYSSNLTLLDVKVKDNDYWLYFLNKSSQNIIRYEIYKSDSSLHTDGLHCSFLSDNSFGKTFAIQNNELLIQSSSSTLTFRRFSMSHCGELPALQTGIYIGYSHGKYSMAGIYEDELYFKKSSSLAVLDLSSHLILGEESKMTLGTVTSYWSSTKSMYISDNILWAVMGRYLWKINLDDNSWGWAELPTSQYKSLYEVVSIIATSESLMIISESDDHEYDVFTYNIEGF